MTGKSSVRVAFQGEHGAFSEEAISNLFAHAADPVPCATFEELFAAIDAGRADFIVAPVENTLAGTIGACYDLWLQSALYMTREAIVAIHHCLIGSDKSSLQTVRTAESHPVALAQCKRFFAEHPMIRAVAAGDTAGSVRHVVESADPMLAAIASERAAGIYGGKVLASHLEDHSKNFTRFALLSPKPDYAADSDTTSLALSLVPRAGTLAAALTIFAQRGIELLKIDGRPVLGAPWQVTFVTDFAAGSQDANMRGAMDELTRSPHANEVKIMGSYTSARASAEKATRKGSKSQ